MLNQYILVGKVLFVDRIINTLLTLDNGEQILPVIAVNGFDGIEEIQVGDTVAVKGKIEFKNGQVQLYVEKLSIVAEGKNHDDNL